MFGRRTGTGSGTIGMEDEKKSLFSSKTFHFNWFSGVLLHAAWPLLPKSFREQPYAMSAVTSWFALGNIVLRTISYGAVSFFGRRHEKNEKKQI